MTLHKVRKGKKSEDMCFFLDTIHDQELSSNLTHGEIPTFHLHLTGLGKQL